MAHIKHKTTNILLDFLHCIQDCACSTPSQEPNPEDDIYVIITKSYLKHGQLFWSHGWCAWHKMDAVVNYPKHLLSTVIPIEDTLESSSSLTFTLCPLTLLQSPRQCKWHYSLLADPQTQRTLKSGETFCIFQLFKTGPTCSKWPGASSSRRTPVAFTISPSGESLLLE